MNHSIRLHEHRGRVAFEAAFHLPAGHRLQWTLPGPNGAVELVLETIFADLGLGDPLPRFIAVDFNLQASDLDAASSDALLMAGFVVPLLALAANAAYRDPQLVTVYDADEASDVHDLRAHFVYSEEHPVLTGSRELDIDAVVALLQGLIGRGQDSVRLHRAMVHYNEALLHWRPVSALKSVEWLFVAVENMAPVALADHKVHSGKTDDELAEEWAVAPRKCPDCGHSWTPHGTVASAARATLVLDGDQELFRKAKDVSEGLEHGYADMPRMQRDASECRDALATAVRKALVRLLGVSQGIVDVLTSPPYDKPQRRDPVNRGVAMKLRGPVASLAPEGERHPLIVVTQEIKKAVLKPDGSGDLTITDNLDFKSGGATAEHIDRFASDRATASEVTSVVVKSADGTIKYDSSTESPDLG